MLFVFFTFSPLLECRETGGLAQPQAHSVDSPLSLLCRRLLLVFILLRVFNNPPVALSDYNVRPPTLVLFLEPGQQSIVAKALRLQARGCVVWAGGYCGCH